MIKRKLCLYTRTPGIYFFTDGTMHKFKICLTPERHDLIIRMEYLKSLRRQLGK